MDCRSCGADLPRDAAFCPRCGERVELGSMLGVGTDLPRLAPHATSPLPPRGPSQPPTPGTGHSRTAILAMVATFVVLTLVGTFALIRIVGPGAPEVDAATSSSLSSGAPSVSGSEGSTAPEPAPPTRSASGASPSPTPTPTPTLTPTPSATPSESGATIPQGARRCSTSGSDSVATAYAGTERTSCEFAAAVRDAYREAGSPDEATSLRAFSPVTQKWYSLSCDGGDPVRCTSTTNAVVLLTP